MKMPAPASYVLITPARNEAEFIELTIESMVVQTFRPIRWVIVSDGSTDGTDDIVCKYLAGHPWMEFIRMPKRRERHFAGKVLAFNAGYARVTDLAFDVVGNLDADVSFDKGHFESLLTEFGRNPELGVAGAPFREGSHQYDYRFTSIEHVWGGCQLFRRECYDQIGGYIPVESGAVDHIAVATARMNGWTTRTFTESMCVHHRKMGTARQGEVKAKFKGGLKDYSVGNHPLWEVARVVYQMTKRPVIIGGAALGAGYAWALIRRAKRPVSRELMEFTRQEQIRRLRYFVTDRKHSR
jgi:glycosyltransferase involved in cell wall biosynthesis